jgi:hypothetical protein
MKHITLFTIVLAFLLMAAPVLAENQLSNETSMVVGQRGVYPPNARPYGVSQEEWHARFTNWWIGIPEVRHPMYDPDGRFCQENQSGKVFFLSSVFLDPGGTFVRNCTVASNKALFLPVSGTFCSPFTDGTTTPEESTECAQFFTDAAINLAVQIDGREIRWQNHRSTTAPFNMYAPDGNVLEPFGFPTGGFPIDDAVADGYMLMLKPMSVGQHTIHVYGENLFFPGAFWDLTLNLNVVPAKGSAKTSLVANRNKPVL